MPTNVSELNAQRVLSLYRFDKAIDDPSFVGIVLFCVIGLVITAVLKFYLPNLGAVIAQYNQF